MARRRDTPPARASTTAAPRDSASRDWTGSTRSAPPTRAAGSCPCLPLGRPLAVGRLCLRACARARTGRRNSLRTPAHTGQCVRPCRPRLWGPARPPPGELAGFTSTVAGRGVRCMLCCCCSCCCCCTRACGLGGAPIGWACGMHASLIALRACALFWGNLACTRTAAAPPACMLACMHYLLMTSMGGWQMADRVSTAARLARQSADHPGPQVQVLRRLCWGLDYARKAKRSRPCAGSLGHGPD